jgi:hypothetical protein
MRRPFLTVATALTIAGVARAQTDPTDPYAKQQEAFRHQRIERAVREFDEFVRMAYYAAGCGVIDRGMAELIVTAKERRVFDLERVDVRREIEPNEAAGWSLVKQGCDWWHTHPEDVDHVRRLVAIETGH